MPSKHTFCPTGEFPPESAAVHLLAVEADSEPLLLPRVLQKFAVPEITTLTVHCETDEMKRTTNIEVRFRATPSRAQLTSLKLEKILSIRKVVLLPQARRQPRVRLGSATDPTNAGDQWLYATSS